jgi:hypothetical protein
MLFSWENKIKNFEASRTYRTTRQAGRTERDKQDIQNNETGRTYRTMS